MDSYKFIMVVVALNIMVGLSAAYFAGITEPEALIESEGGYFTNTLSNITENSQATTSPSSDRQYEETVGDTSAWGKVLLDAIGKGFWVGSIYPGMFEDRVAKAFAYAILGLRVFLNLYLGVLLYQFFINKKND